MTWPSRGWIECKIVTLAGRRLNVKLLYKTGDRKFKYWSSDQLEGRCWNEEHVPEGLGTQAPGWAAQEKGKETLLWPWKWWSICFNSVQPPTHLAHSKTFSNPFEPFQIKWEVYFSKELCPFVSISASLCCILIYMFMQHHNDTIIKTDAGRLLYKNYNLSFYCNGSKGLCGVLLWEGAGDRTETVTFWPKTYGRQRCVFLVLQGCSTGGLRVHSARCWLSLLHLISIFSGPQLMRAKRPLRPDVAFPTTSRLTLTGTRTPRRTQLPTAPWTRTQLSYIMVQRPLDLWSRMFDRHQAEITVMQFTSHSLPVHQSMSKPWEFFSSSYFISQFPLTRFPLLTAIGMCHFLPVHHLEWHFGPGQNVKI